MLTTIISFIVVLGVLIFVHELGHFLVAKRSGVTVLRFSLGFGPKIVSVTRGGTEYRLSMVPLGGYVKMLGEDPDDELPPEKLPGAFGEQSVWKRLAIVFAGPFSNFLLAIVIFTFLFAFSGLRERTPEIGSVSPGSPAEQAGLQPADRVLSINGNPINTWEALSEGIEKFGQGPLVIKLQRNEQQVEVTVTPKVNEVTNLFGEKIKRPLIGIIASEKYSVTKVSPLAAGYYAVVQTWEYSKLFALTVVKLIQRVVPLQSLGGPILIAQMAGQQAQEGMLNLINFIALISVNLAVLNLLPIPVLDGGHIFFFLIEAVIGRPISLKKIEFAQKVGLVVLLALMVVVFYNDIVRLLPPGTKPDFLP
ncbi:MAG: RIP metalloprotease RseP [Desulfobacteraceae bacterium]|nr:RIP metalloprotease RseP [Desulfobacteraceae bacterium]